ncbi:MAG: hypothetical protein IPG12_03340 [Saprospiraceae bacterium]|nr:hypothetical protein [Saprospiraceae bacterium]
MIADKIFNITQLGASILPTITVNQNTLVIPPWQRAGNEFNVKITATTSDGSQWRIKAKDPISGSNSPSSIGNSGEEISFNFSFPNETAQINYVVESINSNLVTASLSQHTEITHSKWTKENVVYYNFGNNQLLIPLIYSSKTISTRITFSRVENTSNSSSNITTIPTVQLGNLKNFALGNNSLIQTVSPEVFNYTISYFPGPFFEESGTFDLTKIGNVHNANSTSNQIVVLVGGIRNEIENDITSLSSSYNSNSHSPWSIANDLSLNYGKNKWYIATSNMNSTQKNAYDLGIALEKLEIFV